MRRFLDGCVIACLIAGPIAGCARASGEASGDASPDDPHDAPIQTETPDDATLDATLDATTVTPADAPPDQPCTPVTTQLLTNPAFDLNPVGTGWQQTLIDPAAPLVTADDGVLEHTAPYKAWLGGLLATNENVVDILEQSVAIPAGTTDLVLSGFYDVRTLEVAGDPAYDTASILLTEADGTPIATALAVSNQTPKTAWTAFSYPVTPPPSGMTIRVRMTSSSDFLRETSFFFDSLQLRATYCP
ncbi:MAG: hypothetical protein AB7P03_01615 [Kofleriaceae bacterium]